MSDQRSSDLLSFRGEHVAYGTAGVGNGKPFVEIAEGDIPFLKLDYMTA